MHHVYYKMENLHMLIFCATVLDYQDRHMIEF